MDLRGDHEDPQKPADCKTEPENKPDYLAFRDKAFLHLYRSMNIAMEEMANEKLHNSVRCKWAHCLAQTVAALCNLIRTLKVLEADVDLKGGLVDVWEEIAKQASAAPKKYMDHEYKEALRKNLNKGFVWRTTRDRKGGWLLSQH